jgi:quercetin dioxygenase-like cupin family protein
MTKTSLALIAFVSGAAAATAATPPAPPPLGSTAVSWEEIEARTGKGNSRPIFRSPTATLEELEMHVTHLAPGKEPHPPHQHPEEEVVIIREGTIEALQNGQTRRLGPGSVLFQASNQRHGLRNVGTVPAVYHVVRFRSAATPKAAPAAAAPAPRP